MYLAPGEAQRLKRHDTNYTPGMEGAQVAVDVKRAALHSGGGHSLRLGPAGKVHPCFVPAVGLGSVFSVGCWEKRR